MRVLITNTTLVILCRNRRLNNYRFSILSVYYIQRKLGVRLWTQFEIIIVDKTKLPEKKNVINRRYSRKTI